jgi:hypothetical protein
MRVYVGLVGHFHQTANINGKVVFSFSDVRDKVPQLRVSLNRFISSEAISLKNEI